jgi:transposase-like protein
MNPAYPGLMAQQSLKQYDREFKLNAIRRANSMGDVKRAAQTLGIREVLLYRWIREARQRDAEQAFPGRGRRRIFA